jgi:hypothetical protein
MEQQEAKNMAESTARLQDAAALFVWAAKIGFFVLLYFVALLVASTLAHTPRAFWMVCFSLSLLALGGHLAAWLILSFRSKGFGISGSFLFWEFWLLTLASVVSALFAFHGKERYLVLFLLVGALLVSTQLVGLLWIVPVRAIGRVLRLR